MAMHRRTGPLAAAVALLAGLLLAGACRVGEVATTPLAGPVPEGVLVLPPVDLTPRPDADVRGLATGADEALRDRGYRALPLAVGFDLARTYGFLPGQPLDRGALFRLHRASAVDAVMLVEVEEWAVEGDPPRRANWHVRWRLLPTRSEGVLWEHAEQGSWARRLPERDPFRREGEEPEVIPFGGLEPVEYRSPVELIRALQRSAMARLPRRE